jgi:Protein of unknown function (DUF2934)
MNRNTTLPPPDPTEAEIQKKAYHLWLEGGSHEGRELDNWFAAKELLLHHHGRAIENHRKPAPKPSAKATVARGAKTVPLPAVARG